jgi:predicted XRE-type DNA-binding protein
MVDQLNYIQTQLFKDLQRKLSKDTLPASEIASLLKISRSEAYNKISGKSQLTLNQLYQLCQKFDLHCEIRQKEETNSCRLAVIATT